jgi:competence protein ComEA
MLKKWMMALICALVSTWALAAVDVNQATEAELDGIKGIGPAMSKKILDEHKKGGDFKNWADLMTRVKGIKDKKAAKLSDAGLTVSGKAFEQASPKAKSKAKEDKAGSKVTTSASPDTETGTPTKTK